jgi:hypothetical protein
MKCPRTKVLCQIEACARNQRCIAQPVVIVPGHDFHKAACAAILALPQRAPGSSDPWDMTCGMARAIAFAEGYNTALKDVRSILAAHGITKDS